MSNEPTPTYASLRSVLLAACIANGALAYLYLVDVSTLSRLYGGITFDYAHQFLLRSVGATYTALAIGALLAAAKPVRHLGVVLLLAIVHFSFFLVDVVTISRAQMPLSALLPELVYNLVISLLLFRFYPGFLAMPKTRREKKLEKKLEKQVEKQEKVVEKVEQKAEKAIEKKDQVIEKMKEQSDA